MFLPREAAMLARSWDRNSVRPSVTRVLCDETKAHTADILILHERVITLFFDTNRDWWAISPSTLNLRLKWPTPFEKRRLPPIAAYKNVWNVRASEKCSIIAKRKSNTRFTTSNRWSAYVNIKSPKGGSKSEFVVFVNKIQVQSNKVCYRTTPPI